MISLIDYVPDALLFVSVQLKVVRNSITKGHR